MTGTQYESGHPEHRGAADHEFRHDDPPSPQRAGRPKHIQRGESADIENLVHVFTLARAAADNNPAPHRTSTRAQQPGSRSSGIAVLVLSVISLVVMTMALKDALSWSDFPDQQKNLRIGAYLMMIANLVSLVSSAMHLARGRRTDS
jgi:hypothetical protein